MIKSLTYLVVTEATGNTCSVNESTGIITTKKNNKKDKSLYSLHYAQTCNKFAGPSPQQCAWATQLLSKKSRNGGEPLATLCLI